MPERIEELAAKEQHHHARRQQVTAPRLHPRIPIRIRAVREIEDTQHPEDEKHYFDGVVKALAGTDEVLVVGPSTAKLALLRYVHGHDPAFAARIVGVETVDHPTDGELLRFARRHFEADDRMRSQT